MLTLHLRAMPRMTCNFKTLERKTSKRCINGELENPMSEMLEKTLNL